MPATANHPPLYRPEFEHDACGVGVLADVRGRRSHELVERGLRALARLAHRGGAAGASSPPDGSGVLTQIPWRCLAADLPAGFLSVRAQRALGMFFVPPGSLSELPPAIDRILARFGWRTACWRPVPVRAECLSRDALDTTPAIVQCAAIADAEGPAAGRSLYRARLQLEREFARRGLEDAAVVSLSTATVVYKGLLRPDHLARFYADLENPLFESGLMIVHERFSTNTFPRWPLAQPFRLLAHNGEINTILANRLWMKARQADATSLAGFQDADTGAVVRMAGSDSQSLDDAVDILWQAGYSLPHAMARLVPPAWHSDPTISSDEAAFYRWQACCSEPWDGPAALAFSDGRLIGAQLDRNGFRPARFVRTADGQFFLGSEAGIFGVAEQETLQRGRLGPGETIVVDTAAGVVLETSDVRRRLAGLHPYREWIEKRVVVARDDPEVLEGSKGGRSSFDQAARADLTRRQRLFGYTREEIELVLRPMAADGREAIGSMGDDTPLAALSGRDHLLPDFFRQRFAQVTNPPLDSLREHAVMSLETLLGPRGDVLDETAWSGRLLALPSPVLTQPQFELLCADGSPVRSGTIPMLFEVGEGEAGLARALERIGDHACEAVEGGTGILVLSDRAASDRAAPVPPLLATAAVHHALIARGCRMRASLVVETGEARDAHQVSALLAFGASAVFPYLAYETIAALARDPRDAEAGTARYRRALEEGLLKVFSKMGVSTCSGYCGGQLFEILGLGLALAERYFPETPCVPGGVTLNGLARQILDRHRRSLAAGRVELDHPGIHGFRKDGEYHANHPALVRQLHEAVRSDSGAAYRRFADLVEGRPPMAIRDLLEFRPAEPISIEQVEPASSICRRFFASAMSVGALSPEAHRAVAIAMNELGGRSNCGEGGEERERFHRKAGERQSNSATKQVASARFGVTPEYLISATELQIKIAQGSKPGEGGQLPAIKAVPHIARLRHAQAGITLISPPPHHDIYSIEDLAQLIYDLKAFHPAARISVKLVAQAGVGIVAAGVVKAGADVIQVSGHDGGTGASPRGSIKHAGSPWELGLAETQQVLTRNGLRDRIVLQTDGGLKTGRDVAIAAALGADEFGFGTAVLLALGCVMCRQCHLGTCPTGIATQREDLRARFSGTPEMVIRYLRFLADDVRALLARLGLRSLAELVGRVDLLRAKGPNAGSPAGTNGAGQGRPEGRPYTSVGGERRDPAPRPKGPGLQDHPVAPYGTLDVRPLLARASPGEAPHGTPRMCAKSEPPCVQAGSLDTQIATAAAPALGAVPVALSYEITNTDRAVGARLAGLIAARFGDTGIPDHPVTLAFTGSAGQSFGAFLLPGMDLRLTGEANDYVGKGMHGGQIVIRPARGPAGRPSDVLAGNTVLYGATGGRLFIAGAAGERFAVRNSGATAVVEGVGDHACEYMTGGLVVVLGAPGRNFSAGMSGGVAFVFDPEEIFAARCNQDLTSLGPLEDDDERRVRALLKAHRDLTGSWKAVALLARWREARGLFRRVSPQAPWAIARATVARDGTARPPRDSRIPAIGFRDDSPPAGPSVGEMRAI